MDYKKRISLVKDRKAPYPPYHLPHGNPFEERKKPQEIKTAGITLPISKGKVSKKYKGKTKKVAAFGCRTT